jgi:hypothetical protein
MSESERLIRARIARLTKLLTELDEYSTPSLMMGAITPLTRIRARQIPLLAKIW